VLKVFGSIIVQDATRTIKVKKKFER